MKIMGPEKNILRAPACPTYVRINLPVKLVIGVDLSLERPRSVSFTSVEWSQTHWTLKFGS
jgi:hypothetical protein